MLTDKLKNALRFYFLTDENAPEWSPLQQAEMVIHAGASMIQYRHKSFGTHLYEEALAIRNLCKSNDVPFVVNDRILLAKAVGADGVHLGQGDEDPALARNILGPDAIVGLSVANLEELALSDLSLCDYIGTGPVYPTQTKKDAKAACGLLGLEAVVRAAPLPVVAIGGIDDTNAKDCFRHGAGGVAVISCISRAENPRRNARRLAEICGCKPRSTLLSPWRDEFGLIERLLEQAAFEPIGESFVKIPAGDDACLLQPITRPVISTDTHKEGVHFRLDWQTPEEVGRKAVEVTFSDLAASYARPVALFVNLALPPYFTDQKALSLYAGIRQALVKHGCALGGGNISRSGELSLDLFAVGQGLDGLFPTRSAAQPGYGLYCTGPLGLARAGLESLKQKDTSVLLLVDRFKNPSARFDAADVLAAHRVNCVIDISDGLAGDANHIAAASGLTVEFDLHKETFHPALLEFCRQYDRVPEEMILTGGEDYELLVACPPETFNRIQKDLPEAHLVGRCLEFNGRHLENLPQGIRSYQHGK